MGYLNRVLKATCGHCGRTVCWADRGEKAIVAPRTWKCTCKYINTLRLPEQWPRVPQYLFIGADKLERLKVYATPPEHPQADWAQPWSVRSFFAQASEKYGSCSLKCERRGQVMGQAVFRDRCVYIEMPEPEELARLRGRFNEDDFAIETDCHPLSGWSTGVDTCPLWEQIAKLCQTDIERRFLHHYLRFVKDRQFPMLVPQPRIGVAERRRPDFVLFVPLSHWNYTWMAIELDGAHAPESRDADVARNADLEAHGYVVFSVRPAERGYMEEVRRLVEDVETRLELAERDVWAVAAEAQVIHTEESDDLPF